MPTQLIFLTPFCATLQLVPVLFVPFLFLLPVLTDIYLKATDIRAVTQNPELPQCLYLCGAERTVLFTTGCGLEGSISACGLCFPGTGTSGLTGLITITGAKKCPMVLGQEREKKERHTKRTK